MVETADAFFRIHEIVRASERIVATCIGGEDFALDNNMQPTGEALFYPKQHMIFAANSAGIMPIGFVDSVAGFGDWDKFRKMVRRSRDFGFMGAGCIHPGQVTIVNEEYTPTADEVEFARKIIKLDKEAAASGRGSWSLDGKMIDIPSIVRAQKLIKRFEAIKAREAKTLAAV
jgi:citrate lyase subunit beta/citryl-CoA lyase